MFKHVNKAIIVEQSRVTLSLIYPLFTGALQGNAASL